MNTNHAQKAVEHLQNPEMEYRPQNYWGWLENISPEETARQVREMARAGLGGYVMHARGGLEVPYMGKEWTDSVRAMVEEGNKYGMLSIVDDEHGWPSGFGAGKVNGKGEDYWLKFLLCEEKPAAGLQAVAGDKSTLGLYRFAADGDAAPIPVDTAYLAAHPQEAIIRVYYGESRYYVDNMSSRVTDAFIEASYEDYKKKAGDLFGKGLFGVFSDEPQTARYATPWSIDLPELFQARYGYSLMENLPAVFYEKGDYQKLRYDLFTLMQECFTNHYAKKLCDWCEQHGLAFMGHTCLEDNFYDQIRCAIGTMPFYAHMTIPGIDWLSRIGLCNMTILQVTSVAAQTGKKRVLCEMYGCAGWNISMEELKWISQWQNVLGINLQLQHLGLYSLKGSRKREYPASLFFQQPWWGDYRVYNDYFARLSKLLSESRPEADILLLHPIKSAWVLYNGNDSAPVQELDRRFQALTDRLLAHQYDFHYGDETLLQELGAVEDGALRLGEMRYHTVLLPDMVSIDSTTLSLLEAFLAQGGRVIAAGDLPTLVDGVRCPDLAQRLAAVAKPGEERFLAVLEQELPPRVVTAFPVDGSEPGDIFCMSRVYEGTRYYYLVNNSLEHAVDCRIETASGAALYPYECTCGTLAETPLDTGRVRLEPAGSLVLFEGPSSDGPAAAGAGQVQLMRTQTLRGSFAVQAASPNALTLDYCALSFDGEHYEAPANHLEIQDRLIKEAKNQPIWLKFTFRCKEIPEGDVFLVVEEPQKQRITVNGMLLSAVPTDYYLDRSFEKLPVAGMLRTGENEIILAREFRNPGRVYEVKNDPTIHEAEANRVTVETELESIYLLGNFRVESEGKVIEKEHRAFSVAGDFTVARPHADAVIENLAVDGYPFFAGSITLEKAFELTPEDLKPGCRIIVSFTRPDAVVTKVAVNGAAPSVFLWAPYEADITAQAHAGKNTLAVTLTNSCRNLLGPHHHTAGELYSVGPFSFLKGDGSAWEDRYNLVRLGLENGIAIRVEKAL